MRDLQLRMEQMFDDPHLTRLRAAAPAHPAVQRYDAIEHLCRDQGSRDERYLHAVVESLRQMLDTMTWVPRTAQENVWSRLDEQTKAHIVAALHNESQFEDTMAELFFFGWFAENGSNVERTEEAPGLCDLVFDRGTDVEVRGDVKRIHADTGPAAVARVVQKANKQVKRSDPPGGGIAFISLGLPIHTAPADDGIPADVEPYIEAARRATQKDNSSIARVILTWEDYLLEGAAPAPQFVAVRRRSVVVDHAQPKRRLPWSARATEVGLTATTMLWPAAGLDHQTHDQLVEALRAYTIIGAKLGDAPVQLRPEVRDDGGNLVSLQPNHVMRAFAQPDTAVVHDTGARAAIVTRRVTTRSADFVLVLHAVWDEQSHEWLVDGGHRLFGDAEELTAFAHDPNEAFAAVLVRYGLRFPIEGERVWWAPSLNIRLPAGHGLSRSEVSEGIVRAMGMSEAPENSSLRAVWWFQAQNIVFVNHLYWIHADRYRAALQEAARRRR